jgi:hypothetical protein
MFTGFELITGSWAAVTLIVKESRLVPDTFVPDTMALNVPALEYVCCGFCRALFDPSPKIQFHVAAAPPVLVALNVTFKGA